MKIELLVQNIGELSTLAGPPGPRAGKAQGDVETINDAAVAVADGSVVMTGEEREVLESEHDFEGVHVVDARGMAVIPGLVDPHTHLVYGGDRQEEYVERLRGTPYVDILKRGGGINDTVRKTREAPFEELLECGLRRAKELIRNGTTTVEIKSGYGLEKETELKMLEVARRIGEDSPIRVVTTFLGAHTIPPEYRRSRKKYVDLLVNEMLEAARPLADACDVFVEEGAFTVAEAERILKRALDLEYSIKIHADQIHASGGSELAARFGAVSADHLDHVNDDGIKRMVESGVIGVLLPGASLFLRSTKYPAARRMIQRGLPLALATDHNPGSCPMYSQVFMMGLACLLLGLTPSEALTAATINAASALGLEDRVGSIEPGKSADLVILDRSNYGYLPYELGRNPVRTVIAGGRVVHERDED
jgi:imidazolonepropionase